MNQRFATLRILHRKKKEGNEKIRRRGESARTSPLSFFHCAMTMLDLAAWIV